MNHLILSLFFIGILCNTYASQKIEALPNTFKKSRRRSLSINQLPNNNNVQVTTAVNPEVPPILIVFTMHRFPKIRTEFVTYIQNKISITTERIGDKWLENEPKGITKEQLHSLREARDHVIRNFLFTKYSSEPLELYEYNFYKAVWIKNGAKYSLDSSVPKKLLFNKERSSH